MIGRLKRWARSLIAEAPDKLAYCEFHCTRDECRPHRARGCVRRAAYAAWADRARPGAGEAAAFGPWIPLSPEDGGRARRAPASEPPRDPAARARSAASQAGSDE